MIKKVSGSNLASNDFVRFPRAGRRRILRMRARFPETRKVSFSFDDGKIRVLEMDKKFEAIISDKQPKKTENGDDLYRLDAETGRISIISESAFFYGFGDIADSFKAMPSLVSCFPQRIALNEIRNGAALFTMGHDGAPIAVYAMEVERCRI